MDWILKLTTFLAFTGVAVSAQSDVSRCNGYNAYDVTYTDLEVSAKLKLAGPACDVYGKDIEDLVFTAGFKSDSILHVKITDSHDVAYQVPETVFKIRKERIAARDSTLEVLLTEEPFSFAVRRRQKGQDGSIIVGETIFNTSGSHLVFESQFWRLRTSLPERPNLYGLGEHTDPLRLNTTRYTRTFWNRDAGAVPEGTNLYSSQPVYFENRIEHGSTHGVALINSNGMDVHIDSTPEDGQYLEYNVLGGIPHFYFFAGPSPFDVSRQYSEISGKAAMIPYWGLGYHQCRYGYPNVFTVAEVVYNHSQADIPLETMWTDIDYMNRSKVFTLDPANYPLNKMRELVEHLHRMQQHYVVMVDPAIAYQNYSAFEDASRDDILMKHSDGTLFKGVVWPGETVFPDWFNPITQMYWTEQFRKFFDPEHGIDIDALWIDMNEPANFCPWPCSDPDGFLEGSGNWINPPPPSPVPNPRPLPGWPEDFQPQENPTIPPHIVPQPVSSSSSEIYQFKSFRPPKSRTNKRKGFPDRDLLHPPYEIHQADSSLSNHGMDTDLIHSNGLAEYDVHNLYGLMMSIASRKAMLARRPHLRPLVVTRSTFISSGNYTAHWLGDNVSSWEHYRQSIRHMLQFTAFFQIPVVGADVCGFLSNTTAQLCARWTRLGAFYPFFRNHNSNGNLPQEAYRWEVTAEAARKGIKVRYRLLDYIYTALRQQTVVGTPMVFPLWMAYPDDAKAAAIELQFFYGPALVVCPVVEENSTEVDVYLPEDLFYDFETLAAVQGKGNYMTIHDVGLTDIPVFVRSGNILPLRVDGANTTTTLRTLHFEILVAPSHALQASGNLYLDDGVSLHQQGTTEVTLTFDRDHLRMEGKFNYKAGGIKILKATILDPDGRPPKTFELGWDLKSPHDLLIPVGVNKSDDSNYKASTGHGGGEAAYKSEL